MWCKLYFFFKMEFKKFKFRVSFFRTGGRTKAKETFNPIIYLYLEED